ncbi:hypothetical protein HD553DRAFT_305032 [Filobasidium floriforme]|uniref:uncharacterized protein n=1 Tax=Filobasidium floriforme TaxID=5210 RepID=UPI001E8CDAAB|nr:uncharacterized protein HD553DRAFT_305032 [Filobasidium floriforme]KAH8089064.1 hypothetical protein HD553DRAFT_305032 [Filobasidium floriforme]
MASNPANRSVLGSSQTSNSGQRTHHRRPSEVHRRTPKHPDLKEWSSNSISWTLRGVSTLFQGYVDVGESATGEREYQLFHSEIGDGRYHLDLVVADSKFPVGMISEEPGLDSDDDNPVPPSPSPRQPNLSLHLYLGLIGAQDIPRERAISTSIFLGLQPGEAGDERSRKSTSSSTSEWMYKKWKEWQFCGETDWFQYEILPLSEILNNALVLEQNAFTLTLHVKEPDDSAVEPLKDGLQVVPSDLLKGLANSLDNKNTGDVQFVCLEYGDETNLSSASVSTSNLMSQTCPLSRTESRTTSSSHVEREADQDPFVFRKRILYAHSDILKHRSEYFKDMLEFNESCRPSTAPRQGQDQDAERKVETIHCEDTDYQTLYWMLRWIYTDDLEFSEEDDVRRVVSRNGMSGDLQAKRVLGVKGVVPMRDEWAWHSSHAEGDVDGETIGMLGGDMERLGSDTSPQMGSSILSLPGSVLSTGSRASKSPGASNRDRLTGTSNGSRPSPAVTPTRIRPTAGESKLPSGVGPSAAKPSNTPSRYNGGIKAPSQTRPVNASPPINTRRPVSTAVTTSPPSRLPTHRPRDPHCHPTPAPPSASSFAIYVLAHEYNLVGLQQVARSVLLDKLTPSTACSLLLASYKYGELHAETQAYVVEHWSAIQQNPAFLAAIQEVSNGLWGPDGGLVLHSLFKRLRT